MTNSARRGGEWLLAFLRENAFAVLIGIFVAWNSFTNDRATLIGKIELLEHQVAELKAVSKNRGRFVIEARDQVNYLCRTNEGCRVIYSPIAAPE